jgi:hypothetical protein
MTGLTTFEADVMRYLLDGDHPLLARLREQASHTFVGSREYTGVGLFVNFESSHTSGFADVTLRFGDVIAKFPGFGEAGFVLFVDEGRLSMLEGYMYEGVWPDDVTEYALYYAGAGGMRDQLKLRQDLIRR